MAGLLPLPPNHFKPIPWAKVAIIAGQWHRDSIDVMVAVTQTLLTQQLLISPDNITTHYLPGSYELPFAAHTLFKADPALDAIIAFGIVLHGETSHDALVLQSVVDGFARTSERFGKAIINEVIGVSDLKLAKAREQSKGEEAAFALSELLTWQRAIHGA